MQTNTNRMKALAVALVAFPLLATFVLAPAAARTGGVTQDFNAAAVYGAKCAMCHGKKAEKKFDATMADDAMAQIVLKGKKAEKPPNMPAYEAKGITAEQASALVAHMKSLRQ